ncbi:MAG TPA: sporulation integral membrane protein YtvI [Ruminiclostridium sp.]|nr:sporulation integral membrane protein YtvI [Ruminiclostridium sp.]
MPETLKKTLLIVLKIILVVVAVLLFSKIVKYIVPFMLAYFFASLIEPIVKFIEKKLHIPRKVGTVFSILVVLGGVVSLATFVVLRLIKEIENVYSSLDINVDSIAYFFNSIVEKVNGIYIQLPIEVTDIINQAARNFTENIQKVLEGVTDFAEASIKFALNIPQMVIFIFVTILATYFMSSDKNTILKFLDRQMPSEWLKKTRALANNVFSGVFGWLRAQLIIMTITFTELLIGLSVIGIQNALLIALIIAVIDILPVLGAGTVLVPWSIVNLLLGDTKLGLSTFLLYVIILFVRQLIEPKIVGKQIGVHPLLTLAGMYIGLQVFGVLGMILGPITVIVIKYVVGAIISDDSFKSWFEKNLRPKKVVLSTDFISDINDKKSDKLPSNKGKKNA